MAIAMPPATAPAPTAAPPAHVLTASVAPHGWTTHRVRAGETLIGLAARYRTTPQALAARNHITRAHQLWAGATIAVPRTSPATTARSSALRSAGSLGGYVMRPGDTLSGIAARHGMTVASLAKANRISPTAFILPGQRLAVRGGAATGGVGATTTRGAAYTVRTGDTLSGIAARSGTTVTALAKANHISPAAFIRPGQRLTLPSSARSSGVPRTFLGRAYPEPVHSAAVRNHAILAGRAVPTRAQTRDLIVQTARRHGVDPALALAIGLQESGWNQRAVSPANAVGVMQVIPAGGRWASDLVGRDLDLLDARDNVTAGVVMLRALTRAADREDVAIAGYYQGLASVTTQGMHSDTRAYVRAVQAHRARM